MISPRSDTTADERRLLGQRILEWQQQHPQARHVGVWMICLPASTRGRPPIYLMVPIPLDPMFAKPVASVFVAVQTNLEEATESLTMAIGERKHRLAWFVDPMTDSHWQC